MRATFECEQCFEEYDNWDEFVQCHGDACHEEICRTNCAKKCPNCKHFVCSECRSGSSARYCGLYCIECAIWDTDEDDEEHNFDYVAKGFTREQGLAYLTELEKKRKAEKEHAEDSTE